MTDEQTAERLEALIRERKHYETYGMTERAAAVDAEIKRVRSVSSKAPAKRAQTRQG